MPAINYHISPFYYRWLTVMAMALALASCTIPRKYQKGKPFLFKNKIEVVGNEFTKAEKSALKQRLNGQLDDSSRVQVKDAFFVLHYINKPPAYDSASAGLSARYMEYSLQHLGFFSAKAGYKADTARVRSGKGLQERVTVTYTVTPGKATQIDTVNYRLNKSPELQALTQQQLNEALLKKGAAVTKNAVYGELGRLIALFRNNGYYKFTGDELRVRGDTTIEALTTVGANPFDIFATLSEAGNRRDKPTIKLSVDLIAPKEKADSVKLMKHYINQIYLLPDYKNGDSVHTAGLITGDSSGGYIIKYRRNLFKKSVLLRNLFLKPGDLYNQENYYKSLNSFSKLGAWQSVNIQLIDVPGQPGKLDMVVELQPVKKFSFESSLEASYSINSNTTTLANATVGNVLGLSGNVSLGNRNLGREGIRMTNALRTGVELNVGNAQTNGIINSSELSFTNGFTIPRLLIPFGWFSRCKTISQQTFISTSLSYINRINLFDLQSINISAGYEWSRRANRKSTFRPLNIEFTRLYNTSAAFEQTIQQNPFLRTSFTTALVAGASFNYTATHYNPKYPMRQRGFKANIETSGQLLFGPLRRALKSPTNILEKYLREFIKLDAEYTYTTSRPKSSVVFRLFGGIGIPTAKRDTTLPFFKQFFGGGANSMRGWPIRGIGRGSQPLAPRTNVILNDRTGDIQLEANVEYRYDIASIIPNSIMLKGALFADVGNVWNFKSSQPPGVEDITQFRLKRMFQQLGVSAGTGLRLDFNYFLLRFDFGFRFKRPDITENNGWQIPSINLKNIFSPSRRDWRYENFNFTIGINYPF
jgi:outer membrane protein insertion porin family